MNDDADASDARPSSEVPDDRTDPASDSDDSTVSSVARSIADNTLRVSRSATARQQRALRRMSRQRKAPSWLKKIPWILFPVYGFMRLHDENYEEHYGQWEEEQRDNYEQQ
jgi:hypothetical protein